MTPTDFYNIAIVITNTNLISYSTSVSYSTAYSSNIYYNSGVIYIDPLSFFGAFDPLRILATLLIFLMIGLSFKKSATTILIWLGLVFTGVINLASIYLHYSVLFVITVFIMYRFYSEVK